MFSILRHRISSNELLTSSLYDERSFYRVFIHDLKRCNHEVIIESPYLTCRRVNELLPTLTELVRREVRVIVNTRNPEHHEDYLRVQAYMSMNMLKTVGVRVYVFNDYRHRKIAILDRKVFYEGSLNILSQCRSREIMRRVRSEKLTRKMMQFLGISQFYW